MGRIGFTELIVILVIALLIFGAKRLPEIGKGLGSALRGFNKGIKGEDDEKNNTGDSSKTS